MKLEPFFKEGQIEKDSCHLYAESKKKKKKGTNEPIYKTERVTSVENKLMITKEERGLVQFSPRSCGLCNPMDQSTPGLPVHHQLQEFTQTHIH